LNKVYTRLGIEKNDDDETRLTSAVSEVCATTTRPAAAICAAPSYPRPYRGTHDDDNDFSLIDKDDVNDAFLGESLLF
jgi:hypothetical protein